MITLTLIAAGAAVTWLALRLRALSGSVPRENDDMIFF